MLGNRIQRARKALGLSLRGLEKHLEISHTAIKKYEDNEVIPSSDMLIKLAKALQVKVEYFFRPSHFTLDSIQYRSHADMPESHREKITAQILDRIEPWVELESLFPISPIQEFSLKPEPLSHCDDIERVANRIRKQWNLGLEPLPSLSDVFERHGIKVVEINHQSYPKFNGLSAYINCIPIIVMGNQWPGDRQRFTLAHELGHLIFNSSLAQNLNEEEACDRFARAFLLPKEALVTLLGEHRNHIESREFSLLKKKFGISIMAILSRVKEVGIISHSLYCQLKTEFYKQEWKDKESGEQSPKERTTIFEQMVFHALAEEYIGESKAAELMNLSLEPFRSLQAMGSQSITCHQ